MLLVGDCTLAGQLLSALSFPDQAEGSPNHERPPLSNPLCEGKGVAVGTLENKYYTVWAPEIPIARGQIKVPSSASYIHLLLHLWPFQRGTSSFAFLLSRTLCRPIRRSL